MIQIRCKECNKLLGRIERAEKCRIEISCTRCKLKSMYDIENI